MPDGATKLDQVAKAIADLSARMDQRIDHLEDLLVGDGSTPGLAERMRQIEYWVGVQKQRRESVREWSMAQMGTLLVSALLAIAGWVWALTHRGGGGGGGNP